MKKIIILTILSLLIVLNGCEQIQKVIVPGSTVPLDSGCVSNEPATLGAYNLETLKEISDAQCTQSNEGIFCFNQTNPTILQISEFHNRLDSSLHNIGEFLERTLYKGDFFDSGALESIPRIENSFGQFITRNFFVSGSHIRFSSIGGRCEDYINEKVVINSIENFTPEFSHRDLDTNFYTVTFPEAVGVSSDGTVTPSETMITETIWCSQSWMISVNDEDLIPLFFDKMVDEPSRGIEYKIINGVQVWKKEGEDLFLIVNRDLQIEMFPEELVNNYIDTYYTCQEPEICTQEAGTLCNPSTKELKQFTNGCEKGDLLSQGYSTNLGLCTSCTPNFQCPDWKDSQCINGIKQRVCKDLSSCQNDRVEKISCVTTPVILPEEKTFLEKYGLILLIVGIIGVIIYFSTKKD